MFNSLKNKKRKEKIPIHVYTAETHIYIIYSLFEIFKIKMKKKKTHNINFVKLCGNIFQVKI